MKTPRRFRVPFTPLIEMELVKHVKDMEAVQFGFTAVQLRKIAFEFAELNNIEHQFNREKKEAGKQWLRCFMSRQSVAITTVSPIPKVTEQTQRKSHRRGKTCIITLSPYINKNWSRQKARSSKDQPQPSTNGITPASKQKSAKTPRHRPESKSASKAV